MTTILFVGVIVRHIVSFPLYYKEFASILSGLESYWVGTDFNPSVTLFYVTLIDYWASKELTTKHVTRLMYKA